RAVAARRARPRSRAGRCPLRADCSGRERVSRRHLTFACEGETLVGTLDEADRTTGLLLVSGGNEIRSGAFAGQASLAARVAAAGHPVFRFDRRGIGDSTGENAGFLGSGPDLAAALAAFRAEQPSLQ